MENPDSLVELSTLVERTLLDTGRLFRKSGSMPVSTHLQRSIPSYYESFQNALDTLSEHIFIAKAFLEKDYEALKAREVAPQQIDDTATENLDEKGPVDTQPTFSEKIDLDQEVTKVEAKTEDEIGSQLTVPVEAPLDVQQNKEVAVKEEMDAKQEPVFSEATDGLNFDSVLNESGGSTSFNLNLDFGDDDMGNQAFLSGSAFGNAGSGGIGKLAKSQPQESSTVTVPTGGDAFDMELQKTDSENSAFPDQNTGMEDMMAPGESSFDDLFMESENLEENGTGDLNKLEGDDLMNISELDDNWFT